MERLEELSGLLSLHAHPMARTFLTAIMLSVSCIVPYICIITVSVGLKERIDKVLSEQNPR